MDRFPLFLELNGQGVVIAGGGEAAAAKARLLAAAGAEIDVYADGPPAAAFPESVRLHGRAAEAADFAAARLAIIATDDPVGREKFVKAARDSGALLNVVDAPDLCDFIVPAVIDRGEVVVAVSTGGAAPVLARRIREKIEQLLPARIGGLAAFARSLRPLVAGGVAPPARREFWERFFSGPAAARYLAGDESGARREADAALANSARNGAVHIVGAGPGDPDLLTLRALRLLQDADVILYDRLVTPEILSLARRDAARIYVGKARANHSVPQAEIADRMIALAKEGKTVVRLKGGDPFIFGRGGEELEAVRAADVPVFVTPGITAALGCAASAGAPLTHRDLSQAVTFVTGEAKDGADPDIDWSALAALRHTLVVYMGTGAATAIAERLIAAGRDATTPIAVIENGTRADERILTGLLGNLGATVEAARLSGPALLFIGETAAWASERDLKALAGAATERVAA